jgi:hypothetical protein
MEGRQLMTFNIQQFISNINSSNGLVKTNKFQVIISPKIQIGDSRKMTFFCDQATLPGVTWTTSDVRTSGYGNFVKRPTNATFTDVTLQFFVDGDSNVMKYFHRWMSNINNFDSTNMGSRNGLSRYLFNYPDEYSAVVEIIVYDDGGEEVTNVKLNDAFPIAITDQQLSWEGTGVMKMSVSFAYDSWSSNHFDDERTSESTGSVPIPPTRRENIDRPTETRTIPLPPSRPGGLNQEFTDGPAPTRG